MLSEPSKKDGVKNRLNIMFVGDSITLGTNSTAPGGFRDSLLTQLGSHLGFPPKSCGQNAQGNLGENWMCGASGQRIDNIIDNYVPYQVNCFPLDIVVVHLGTNDATQRNSGSWVGGTEAKSVTNMSTLVDVFRNTWPKCKVFVAKIVPNTDVTINDIITSFNSAMATNLAGRSDSASVIIVDHNAAFKLDASWATDYMGDATHPNAAGYTVMANTWYAAIGAIF